jgi:hypothetical protein
MHRSRHRRLTSTLARALQAKAGQVQASPTATPFDPARPTSLVTDDDSLTDDDPLESLLHLVGEGDERSDRNPWGWAPGRAPGMRQRRRLLRAAAVVFVAALVGAALAAGPLGRDDRGDTSTSETTTTAPADEEQGLVVPDGTLVPSWAPEGMDLWTVSWNVTGGFPGQTYQLFGDPDDGRSILVWFQPDPGPRPSGAGGDPVTVRGQAGALQPAMYLPDTTSTLLWEENGAAINASFRGMTTAEAVAALDALDWRSADYQDGFAEPDDGSYPLQGETAPGRAGAILAVQYWYSEGVPTNSTVDGDQRVLLIATMTASGGMSPDYLVDWFYGDRDEGGPTQRYQADFGSLDTSWPDGRTVYVDPMATPVDRADVERVTQGVAPGSPADFEELIAEADGNALALPRRASADTSRGTLEVHGQGGFSRLCLARGDDGSGDDGRRPDCGVNANPNFLDTGPHVGMAITSFVVDGTWYLGVASDRPEQAVVTPMPPPEVGAPAPAPYPSESFSDGAWWFVLAEIPDDVDDVRVMGGSVRRPD